MGVRSYTHLGPVLVINGTMTNEFTVRECKGGHEQESNHGFCPQCGKEVILAPREEEVDVDLYEFFAGFYDDEDDEDEIVVLNGEGSEEKKFEFQEDFFYRPEYIEDDQDGKVWLPNQGDWSIVPNYDYSITHVFDMVDVNAEIYKFECDGKVSIYLQKLEEAGIDFKVKFALVTYMS